MSHRDVTTWTCDSCSRPVAVNTGDTPAGWQIVTAMPVDTAEQNRQWEVCPGCYSQVERLLMNRDNVDAATTLRVA